MNISKTNDYDQEINNQAIEQLLATLPKANTPVFISLLAVGLVFIYLAHNNVSKLLLLNWYIIFFVVLMYCRWVQVDVCSSSINLEKKLLHVRFSSLLLGIILSSFVIFFPQLAPENRTIISCILLTTAASSINHLRGHPNLYFTYAFTLVLPQTLVYFTLPMGNFEDRVVIPILCLIALFIYFHLAKTIWKSYCDNIFVHRQEKTLRQSIANSINEVKSVNYAKSSFLAAASHDLRQPLQSIDLLVKVLQLRFPQSANTENNENEVSNSKIIANLEQVTKELSYILDDLLDYSRIELGALEAKLENFNLSSYLQLQFTNFHQLILAHNLQSEITIEDDIYIVSDRKFLSRILRNLVHNAIKFTNKGHINLRLEKRQEIIAISVEDSGCGISEQHQQMIFQEYIQLNNPANLKNKGYGLGLAIVKGLSQLLNIQIELKSELNKGSCFTLLIRSELINTNFSHPVNINQRERLSTLSLLLIEDNVNNRFSTKLFLQELGLICWEAKDADEALTICQQIKPDVIISDYRLGNEDGLSLINKIHKKYPKLPAILISGEDSLPETFSIDNLLTYLKKPIEIDHLIERLLQIEEKTKITNDI